MSRGSARNDLGAPVEVSAAREAGGTSRIELTAWCGAVVRAGRFVGRVGALAVALGVGVAVASSPGVAWADETATSGPEGTSTTGTSPETTGTSTAAGAQTDRDSTSKSGSRDAPNSNISAGTEASVRQVPPGTVLTTGGKHSPRESSSENPAKGDVVAESTTDDTTPPKRVADTTATNPEAPAAAKAPVGARGGSDNNHRPVDQPNGPPRVDATTVRATAGATPPRPEPSEPAGAIVDVAVYQPAEPQAVTAVTARTYVPSQTDVVARQSISAAPEEPTPVRPVSGMMLGLLGAAGLGPLATNGPLTPVDSPLGLALAAWGTRPRQFGQAVAEETRSQPASSTLTSLSVDGEQAFAALATAAAPNSAPNVAAQPVGIPDPVTGVVTGTVVATDADNNALTYTVTDTPTVGPSTWATAKGTVTINQATGAYTYTPTQAARLAAGATALADTDTFTVTVSDGQQTTTAPVSVYVSPTRFGNQTPITVGTSPSGVVVSPDGKRTYVANTGSNTVSVINTVTGQRIDANPSSSSMDITVGSSPSALALSPDGKRLYVANTGSNTVSVINTDTYKLIDTNTSSFGTQSISVGSSPSALALSGTRLYVANRGSNTVSVINTDTYKLIDTNTSASGTQSISVGSSPSALLLSGTQLYVANRGSNTVSVVNTSTNSVTNTITVGSQPSSVALGADGGLYVANTGNGTLSVINTATNTLIDTNPNALGTNSISVGSSPSSVALSPDGSFAYVANANDTISVINTKDYAVVSTVAIDPAAPETGGHVIAVSPNGTVYVTDAVDRTVRVLAIARGNTAPIAGTPTVGTPDASTGAVSGALNFTDADGDTLSYSLTQPSTGAVSITSAGVYTFIPTQAARQAAANGGPINTSFTVNATDGQATTSVGVTVPIAPAVAGTGVIVIGNVTLPGGSWGSPLLNADGTRAVVTTIAATGYTTRVAVINTATGTQTGTTLTLAGNPAGLQPLSTDGSRVLITTSDATTTRVAVINTTTGTQTGTTLSLPGETVGSPQLSADGTRALITTRAYDPVTVTTTIRVATIDTSTLNQTGTTFTFTLAGSSTASPLLSADGTRALITTAVPNPATGVNDTRATFINTSTGTQTGTTLTIPGETVGSLLLSADGSRAMITTEVYDSATRTDTIRVAVINTTTGTQTGTTLIGSPWRDSLQLTADGTHVLFSTYVYDWDTATYTTRVAVINTNTGSQTGTTLTLPGTPSPSLLLSADGTRTLVTSTAYNAATGVYTTQAAVVDTVTGTQIGTTLTLTGPLAQYDSLVLSADGTHALITTGVHDASTYPTTGTTRVAVINTTNGTQTGTTLTLPGDPSHSMMSAADGTRALITTYVPDGGAGTTRVTAINTTTGAQTGTILTGHPMGSPVLNADGTRALITTGIFNLATGTTTTQVAVLNNITGAQTATLTLTGAPSGSPLLSADGTHALITTFVTDPKTGLATTTTVSVLRIV
jgi:YVTN family beta-propeller protein/VCBS repeat-containing protein